MMKAVFIVFALAMPSLALAQGAGLPAFTSTPSAGGGQTYSLSLQTLLLLTSLSFLPAALLMMTSFTRIIIVLSLLRMALGTQSTPPNQVLIGLALFLTLFVMAPTFDKIYVEVIKAPVAAQSHSRAQPPAQPRSAARAKRRSGTIQIAATTATSASATTGWTKASATAAA